MRKEFKDKKHRDKILDRIRKVLAVAEGSQYQAEAETAMKMAQSYMKQYGLSMSEVELKASLEREIVREPLDRIVKNQEKWEFYVCRAISIIFDCEVIKAQTYSGGWVANFVGYKEDVEMCKLIFNCILISTKSAANKSYKGDMWAIRSFLTGVGEGLLTRAITEKLKAQEDKKTGKSNSYALVVVSKKNQVRDWLKDNMELVTPKARKEKPRNLHGQAYMDGVSHSEDIDLCDKEKSS